MATTALVPNVKPVLAKSKEPRPKHSKPQLEELKRQSQKPQ